MKVFPLFCFAIGPTFAWDQFGPGPKDKSLFWNGIIFFRLMLPFYVGLQLRWCANCNPSFFQIGLGWDLNGNFSGVCRFQTDESAAAGVSGPNLGQATGWNDGPH